MFASNFLSIKALKRAALYTLCFPFYLAHRARGVHVGFVELSNLLRYVPSARVSDGYVTFKYKSKLVKLMYGYLTPMVASIFGNHEYDNLNVKNMHVVDIGASLGDTAILFRMNGARSVEGYELNRRNYELAIRNISENNLSNIDIHYCGVSNTKIMPSELVLGAIMSESDYSNVSDADFKTLDDILNKFSADEVVLKVDVDGYEYQIFESVSVKNLKKCKEIFIEYHFGVKNLGVTLSNAGFSVQIKTVNYINADYHPEGFKNMEIGYIYAVKNDKL